MPTDEKNQEEVPATIMVERNYKQNGQPTWSTQGEPEKLPSRRFLTPPAYVRAGTKATLNLGNYESVSIDVSVTLPCYPQELTEAFKYAWQMVEIEMGTQVAEVRKEQADLGRGPKGRK